MLCDKFWFFWLYFFDLYKWYVFYDGFEKWWGKKSWDCYDYEIVFFDMYFGWVF